MKLLYFDALDHKVAEEKYSKNYKILSKCIHPIYNKFGFRSFYYYYLTMTENKCIVLKKDV